MHKRFHKKLGKPLVLIQPGECYVTDQDEAIATLLGSCISVCIKDELNSIAGMNHFMLPGDFGEGEVLTSQSGRYGMYAMELILRDIIKLGGDRRNLTAKVFGGGHVLNSITRKTGSVPAANIRFIKSFLSMEGIRITSSDLGGLYGRKVVYLTKSGKAYVKKITLKTNERWRNREDRLKERMLADTTRQGLTLFEK